MQRASWNLELCDIMNYVASHLHIGSPSQDYPPPLVPIEPPTKPADPFAPPNRLPQISPVTVKGCSYRCAAPLVACLACAVYVCVNGS